jgi:cell division protein FtsB|tara:strand:+ start:2604 stop:2906 length:303 start_codon:yes stop_codon:yes gene_type:complete
MKFILNLLNLNFFFNSIILLILLYLSYHLFYGRYNIGNYLVNDFQESLYQDQINVLIKKKSSLDKDLYALYSGREDFLDEIMKKKYPHKTSPGEVLIKIN